MNSSLSNLFVGIFGSADFCSRTHSVIRHLDREVSTSIGQLHEAWSKVLTHKPNLVICELGFLHTESKHSKLRSFLRQVRERFGNDVFVALALPDPTKLLFGGDLLFEDSESLVPSGLIDSFVVVPPSNMPNTPTFNEQLVHLVELVNRDFIRRAEGGLALPHLGEKGWAQSIADPTSLELWLRWLPKYASYRTENPLVIGETGTGKTNLALALHLLSGRKGDFISITPRDFSSSELVQAELFGAVSGAYTGAVDKWGLVKSAEHGTLFIDEFQSIDKDLQGKLITFIENKTYRRVGSSETTQADVRFIFASNRNLYDMMKSEVLRDDFAYRLERVMLEIQPLRFRRLDVAAALAYGLAKIHRQREVKHPVLGIGNAGYRLLFAYEWPGNLRQLENFVAKMTERAEMQGKRIIDHHIVSQLLTNHALVTPTSSSEVLAQAAARVSQAALAQQISNLTDGMKYFEREARMAALEAKAGDVEEASSLIADDAALMATQARTIVSERNLNLIKDS
ncbi:MAG: sigma 54-interacting transcriptional regulator [Bdellovibrionales bacterium]|nr:sigma 54-interacting transcriptional regulator [Bdellovibrionales bacterium]